MRGAAPADKPVSQTSRWMAAARARETGRKDRLFSDPLAAGLAGPEGFAWLARTDPPGSTRGPGAYSVIRTRFFDDFLQNVCRDPGVRQVVLVAAGMDSRAFRLDWPAGTHLYELDLPAVLDHKDAVLGRAGAEPRCARRAVGVDLEDGGWPRALRAAGYRPEEPSVWLAEGLLLYLSQDAVEVLLERIGALAAGGSFLGADILNRRSLLTPVTWPTLAALAWSGAPGRFGTDEPNALLSRHGWRADVTQPGEEGANFGRWPNPAPPRWVKGLPRAFLIRAQHL